MALRVFFLALLSACALAAEVFYYNAVTGAVQWTRPSEMPFTDSHGGAYWLVDGEVTRTPPLDWAWVRGEDENGTPFWHNSVTKESLWDMPKAAAWSARDTASRYYVNSVTGEARRERPAALGHFDEGNNATYYEGENGTTWDPPDRSAWAAAVDEETHLTYYYNTKTGETVWEPPADSNAAWQTWHDEVTSDDL